MPPTSPGKKKTIAVEIETDKSDIKRNISKALTFYTELYIIPTNQSAQVQTMDLVRKLPEITRKRIGIIPAKDNR